MKKEVDKKFFSDIISVNQIWLTGENMPKDMKKVLLFDFYGQLLSDQQRDFFDLYYNEDLSLGETVDNAGITRQAVLGNIRKAEKNLEFFENKLSLLKKQKHNAEILRQMTELINEQNSDGAKPLLKLINQISF